MASPPSSSSFVVLLLTRYGIFSPILIFFLLPLLPVLHADDAEFFLKADGTVLRNHNGQGAVVNLRGVNLGGWLLQEKWMSPMDSCDNEGCNVCGCPRLESQVMCTAPDEISLQDKLTERFGEDKMEELLNVYRDAWIKESDLDIIHGMGLNLVRVPIFYRMFMDDGGNWKEAVASASFKRLDWLLAECAKRRIYVVLDLHGTVGAQNMWDNSGKINQAPQLWTNEQFQEQTVSLWEKLAAHFAGNPWLAAYDLVNEPDRVSRPMLNNFYDRVYQAVRANDAEHAILIEAPNFEMVDAPGTRNWTNVIYSIHVYDIAHWYNRQKQVELVDGYLDGIRRYQSEWQVPLLVGEFCLFKEYDLWEKFIDGLNGMDVSWCHWSYKMVPEDFGPFYWAYFVNNSSPIPDPASDSADEIAQKWKQFGTENFTPVPDFQALISRCAAGNCSAMEPPSPNAASSPASPALQQLPLLLRLALFIIGFCIMVTFSGGTFLNSI